VQRMVQHPLVLLEGARALPGLGPPVVPGLPVLQELLEAQVLLPGALPEV